MWELIIWWWFLDPSDGDINWRSWQQEWVQQIRTCLRCNWIIIEKRRLDKSWCSSMNHMIIKWSSNDHHMIIKWSSHDHQMTCCWIPNPWDSTWLNQLSTYDAKSKNCNKIFWRYRKGFFSYPCLITDSNSLTASWCFKTLSKEVKALSMSKFKMMFRKWMQKAVFMCFVHYQ